MKSTLYLIPSLLGETSTMNIIPAANIKIVEDLTNFIVEDIRSARRFLKKILPSINIDSLTFNILDEHTRPEEISSMLDPLLEGNDIGLISEAGLPCVADPGSLLVSLAHQNGIKVTPLTGPSSIFLALMASGFNGQNFAFKGYLPIDKKEKRMKIKELEASAYQYDQTQIFIETPYRNKQLLDSLLETCKPNTRICIAVDLTLPSEVIISQTVLEWKRIKSPDFHKRLAVFLLYR